MSVSAVDTASPPITARARGALASLPTSTPRAMGKRPTRVVRLVMTMGRRRVRPARITASWRPRPWRRSSFVYSTRRTPLDTRPVEWQSTPDHCMDPGHGVKLRHHIRDRPQMRYATLSLIRGRVSREMSMLSETRPPKVGRWSEPALRVLRERYLSREAGVVTETPEEMCWRVARAIAAAEVRFGRSASAVAEVATAFYDMMVERLFLPNSPTLMNAGKGNQLQYSACYVLPVGDSMQEIFDSVKAAAIIQKSGGGTGFAFSRLRPKNDLVKSTGGRASGPVSFLRVFNAATEAVKQGGCVAPDTRISTNRGVVPIRTLGPATTAPGTWHIHRQPLLVATDDGVRESAEFYSHGMAQVRRIRTRNGYSVCATLEHRLRVIDRDGAYVWKAVEDIGVGEWVVLQKRNCLPVEHFRFPAFEARPHFNSTPVRI